MTREPSGTDERIAHAMATIARIKAMIDETRRLDETPEQRRARFQVIDGGKTSAAR
jgi:hypothetical protein